MQIVEFPGHPFFIGAQFHPEFKSRPGKPSPLFSGIQSHFLSVVHSNSLFDVVIAIMKSYGYWFDFFYVRSY